MEFGPIIRLKSSKVIQLNSIILFELIYLIPGANFSYKFTSFLTLGRLATNLSSFSVPRWFLQLYTSSLVQGERVIVTNASAARKIKK